MFLLLSAGAALALDLVATPLAPPAERVAASGATVVLAADGELCQLDGALDSCLFVGTGAPAQLALADLDADDALDLIVCGEDGVAVRWSLGAEELLDPTPCTRVLPLPQGLVAATDRLTLWELQTDGALGPTELDALEPVAQPRLAHDGLLLALLDIGASRVQLWWPVGADQVELADTVNDLVALDGVIWAAVVGEPRLIDLAGTERSLLEPAVRLVAGDLDGDGFADLAGGITWDDGLVLRTATGEQARVEEPGRVSDMAVSDLDGDGCDELVAVDSDGVAWLVAEAECDPVERLVVIDLDSPVDEGDELTVLLHAQPELSVSAWSWEVHSTGRFTPSEVLDCVAGDLPDQLSCVAPDDGRVRLEVRALDEDGEVLGEASSDVEVRNVAPVLSEASAWEVANLDALWGETEVRVALEIVDPGNDTVRLSLEGCGSTSRLEEHTLVAWTEGDTWEPCTLWLRDEDGGATAVELELSPVDSGGSQNNKCGSPFEILCGSCCPGTAAVLFGPLWLRRRLRQRPRARRR